MNSLTRPNYDCNPCKKEKKCNTTLVKCGIPSSTTLPAATVAGTTFTLASLTVDTSCLKNACVKLDFSSNLVATVAFTGTVDFRIFKLCRGQFTPVPVGPTFTFSLVALLTSQTFSFSTCDCDSCNDECCTYTVVATVTSAVTVGTLAINNAALNAIVAENSDTCC